MPAAVISQQRLKFFVTGLKTIFPEIDLQASVCRPAALKLINLYAIGIQHKARKKNKAI